MRKHGASTKDASSVGDDVDGNQADEPELIPRELAGRWIAWSADGLRIIGSGASLKDAVEVASAADEPEAIFERTSGFIRQ